MAEKDFEADDLELKDYGFEPETYTVNNVQITDYTGIEHDKIFLVNKKDVLTKPRPSWIPELDENCLEREDFLPHCVKDSDGYYFVQKTSLDVPEDYNGPKLSDYEKRQKFTKKTYYKMSLDLIAATCDYYIKKRRAEIKLSGDTHRVGFPRSAGSMTWARYDDMVSMFSLCEAYKDDPEITKNYGHIKARRSNTKHKGYIRQTEIAFHDHYGPLLQELKDKKLDMNLQKQDAADTHKKGEETSYGMSGRSDTLKKDYGVTIKKQNGTSFDSQQLKNISEALENVWNHYGKLDDVAIAFNLGISYAANTLQHARKAVGIFHPEYHAIGVSFFEEKVADSKDSSMVLCHEVAHWLDFEKGNRDHFHYASDKSGTLENKIALKFKELVRKRNSGGKKLGDYWYRTCECLARAMEEDYGLKHDCYDFYNDQAYLTPEVFKKEIVPLVEQLLEENRNYFNLVKKENLSQELSTAKDLSFSEEVKNQPEKKEEKNIEKESFQQPEQKKVLSSLSSDDSFVSDFRSGKFNSIFDRLSDLNFKDDFISSGSLYSKSRIEGINNLWLELFKDGVPPAVIKFENEWEKKIEDGNFNAPSFREKWIEEASKAENEKLLSYFSKMSVPDENLISEHNGHLFRTMIINAIAKQSRFLTEHTDPFSNIVLYQKPECLLEKKLRYEIIENEIKKRGLKIMQDKEIENNKETSEKTDPEAAEKKAGKTKYKANDQKYISKFLDKDGITIDFERWTKNDNPTKILGYNYELSLKFPITKNYLDCFARFVIDETEPDGTFIKNHIDFTAEEYINSISSYYNERNEHYPDQDEFDAIRWKYITDGQKLVRLGFTKIRDIDSDITDALIKTGRENFKDELGFYTNSSRENCRVFKLDGNAGNPLYIIHNFETQQYGVMQDVNPEKPGATYFHAEGFPELDGLLMHLGERTNLSAEEEIQNIISTDNIHLNNEHGENGWHSMDMFVADEKYIKASAISDERFAMPVASWKDGEPEITVSMVSLLISDPENHDKEYLDVSSEGKPSISSDEKWNLIREQKTFDILGEQIKNLSHKGISNEETDKLFEKAKAIFMENSIDVNNFNIDKMSNSYVELFRDNVTGKLITEELNQMGFVKDPDGNYVLDDIKVSLSFVYNNKENPALIISHISDPAVMETIHLNDSYAKKHSLAMSFEDLLESGWLKETKNPNLKSFIDGNMLERDFIGKYIPDADNNKAVTLLDDITAYEEGFSDVLKSFKDFKDASEQEVFEFGGKLQKALYNAAEAIKDKKAYADSLLRYAEKYKPGMEDPDNVYGKFQFHEDELKVFLKVNMINASIYNISMDKNRDGAQIIFALMSSKDKRHYGYITADFDDPANCKYNFTDLKDHNLDISLTENISRMRDFYEASEKHSVNIELTPDGSKLSLTFNEVPDIDLRSSLNWAGFKYSTIAKAWKADFNQENSDKLLATVKKYWPEDYEHAAKQMEGIRTKPAPEHNKESISVDFSQIENTSEKLAENIKFINEKYPEYKGNLTHILTDIMFNATSKNRNEILDKFRDCNNKDELNSKLKKMIYGSFETEIKKQQNVKPKKKPEEGFSR